MNDRTVGVRGSRLAIVPWIVAGALLATTLAYADARADLVPGLYIGRSVTHQGIPRYYDELVPASYDGSVAVPLVIDMHGYGNTAEIQRNISGFAALAETESFIVAWPQGIAVIPGKQTWTAGPNCTDFGSIDDVGFIRVLVAAIGTESTVDHRRIYVTGHSCGGAMTHRLACEAADLFAAAATFAWPLPIVPCAPSRAMPILMTHGRQDWFVPYPGGHINNDPNLPEIPSAHFGFEEWRLRDGCSGSSPDVTENTGTTSVCELYTSCGGGAKVGLCSVDTDPDVFRGHRPYQPYVLDGFNTGQRAWDFLSSFSLPAQAIPALSFPAEILLEALLAVAIAIGLRYRLLFSGAKTR